MKTGPAFPLTRKYDGVGGYAKNSHKIPASGWIGGALFCIGFFALCWIGTGAGF
jgi:hypothetical protein